MGPVARIILVGHPKENWLIVELVLATIIIIANCPQENWVIVESASPTATLRSCKPEQSGTDWLAISAERQRMNPDPSPGHFFIGQISRHRRLLSTHLWKYWQLVVTLCVQLRFLQSKFIDYYELAPLLATQRQVCSHGENVTIKTFWVFTGTLTCSPSQEIDCFLDIND